MRDDQMSRQAAMQAGGDSSKLYQLLMQGGNIGAAQKVQKAQLDYDTGRAGIAKDEAATKKTLSEAEALKIGQHADILSQVQTPEQAMMWAKMGLDAGVLKPEQYQLALSNINRLTDPQSFEAWKQQAALGARKFIELNKPNYQNQNLGGTMQTLALPGLGGKPQVVSSAPITQSADSIASNARMASEGALNRAQSQGQFDARQMAEQTKLEAPKRAGPMSVTLQKELLESDDAVQTGKSVISTLENALKLNDKAYSGYFAKGRATLTSNLGGSESADATINIDNMMTGQGLDQMKSIFGAAPTEGERKILMDMQASADKTPKQRKDIMERAITAAERRVKYAESKAKSIRGGTYLTEGVQPVAENLPAANPQDAQALEWAKANPNDPRSKEIVKRLGGK
jgi:hypothetical protein